MRGSLPGDGHQSDPLRGLRVLGRLAVVLGRRADVLTAAVVLTVAGPGSVRAEAPKWETPRVPIEAPAPASLGTFSALACGACHPEIAAEWAASTHGHAWTDRQFQAERSKDPAVAWLCDNCHTPLARQQAVLSSATGDPRRPVQTPNSLFEPALREEGITCLTCHWRPAGIASIHADAVAPHALVLSPELRGEGTCTVCHQAVARVGETLVCTFNTGEEWRAAAPGKTCPECHMPRVTRPMAVGGPVRTGGRHLWPGGLVPKSVQSPAEAALFADWQPGARIRVEAPTNIAPGFEVLAGIYLEHQGAGHRVPTGDPERYLWLVAEAVDSSGRVLARTTHRAGQVWTWWPVARRESDNRLSPGESRVIPLRFTRPANGDPVTIRARLEHHRISPENARHHALGDYPTMRLVQSLEVRVPGAAP